MPDPNSTRSSEKTAQTCAAAITVIFKVNGGMTLVGKIVEIVTLTELIAYAQKIMALAFIACVVAWIWAKNPQLRNSAITTASLTASQSLIGIPISHSEAVQIVGFLIDKQLVDQKQELLPEVKKAFAGAA